MKARKILNNKFIHGLIVAFIVGMMYALVLYVNKIVPFGDNTRLMYDMKRQYADFYAYYKTLLSGENNILYSFELSLGAGAVGFFTYYLTSPFLLLFLAFDKSQIPVAINIMVGLKLIFMAYLCDRFLQYYLEKEDSDNTQRMTILFAVCYTFSSYVMSNSLNPMWLDVYMMMPVVIWMLDRLLYEKKRLGYIISLAYMIYCNYYIAYMVCIFIVIWTVYRICVQKDNRKMLLSRIWTLIYCSLTAVALDAWCLIPTVAELFNSPKDITKLGMETTKGNLGLTEIFSKIFVLSFDYNQTMYGTPLLYAGVLIILLTVLYFMNAKIKTREKICMALMFIVFVISFCVDIINLCWHAGMEPSGYPYREAFMYVFLCIICSCRCVNTFKEGLSVRKIFIAGAIVLAFFGYVVTKKYYFVNTRSIFANASLIIAYTLLMIYLKKGKSLKEFVVLTLVAATAIELTANATYVYAIQGITNPEKNSEFAYKIQNIEKATAAIKANSGFYRVENYTPREQNDGLMFDYHPITHYSSAGTLSSRYALKDMGFNDDELYADYSDNNTSLSDMLLGVKYVMSEEDCRHKEYKLVSDGIVKVYENPYALSIANLVKMDDIEITGSPFAEQEKLLESIIGRNCDVFVPAEVNIVKQTEEDMEVGTFDITAKESGDMFFYLDNIEDYSQNMEIFLKGKTMGTYGNSESLEIINLGYYEKGDKVDFKINAYGTNIHEGRSFFVTEDADELKKCYEEAKSKAVNIEEKSSSELVLTLPKGYEQLGAKGVMLSIPYDSNWEIYGKKAEYMPNECADYFLYIPIEDFVDGVVNMKYEPAGLTLGLYISGITLLGVIIPMLLNKNGKKCE